MPKEITLDQARTYGTALANKYGAAVYTHASPGVRAVLTALEALEAIWPVVAPIGQRIKDQAEHVSTTIPTPFGTVIVLSPRAIENPLSYVETITHECVHAHQIKLVGNWQTAVDYLGSGELRATREAQAYLVGLYAKYLLDGVTPSVEDAMSRLGGGLYHLDHPDEELGRGIIVSGIACIEAGVCPPYAVAIAARDLLDLLP